MHRFPTMPRWTGPIRLIATLSIFVVSLTTQRSEAEGVPVGKWLFSPSVETVWQSEDNLFLQANNPESATSYAIRPRFAWHLPFRESHVEIVYAPQARQFLGRDEDGLDDIFYSHFIDMETKLVFSNRLTVEIKDSYVIDTLETNRFDPGGEVPFNAIEYRSNQFSASVMKELAGRHAVGLQGDYEVLDFDDSPDVVFLNYDLFDVGLVYTYRLTPVAMLRGTFTLGQTNQERNPVAGESQFQDFSIRQFTVGIDGGLGRHGLLQATVGYTQWDFEQSGKEDFNGLTLRVKYQRFLNQRMSFTITGSRYPRQSFFNVNNYYVSISANVRFEHQIGPRFVYSLRTKYRINDYPEPFRDRTTGAIAGPRRDDDILRADIALGVKFTDMLRADLTFRHIERESTFDSFEYDADRILLQVSLGWF